MNERINAFIICAKDKHQDAKKFKDMLETGNISATIDNDIIDVNNPTWAKDVLEYISKAHEIIILLSEGLDKSTLAEIELNYIDEEKVAITLYDVRNNPSYKLTNKRLQELYKKYLFSESDNKAITDYEKESKKADSLYDNNNFKEAFKIYNKLAKKGDDYATWMIADMYEAGNGVKKNKSKAAELFVSLAYKGDILAAVRVIETYLVKGDTFLINMTWEYIEKYEKEHLFTRIVEVHNLLNGLRSSRRQMKKGLALADEILEEYPQDPVLMGILGDFYIDETKYLDLDKAHHYYVAGYENNNPKCAFALGLEILSDYYYDNGFDLVKKDDLDKALVYLDQAASAGYVPALAMKTMIEADFSIE